MYPKDHQENIRFRASIIEQAERDPLLRATVRELAFRDILFYFNVFLWTFDPRTKEQHHPFITYDFQDKIILDINEAIEKGENLFIDKSRDMGATWMILGVMDWRWGRLATEHFRIGSRKEDMVDQKGDMDTHFEKLRYIHERLPWWMLPEGFDHRKHGQTYMKILNPKTGSALIGEATNRDFGRGGRSKGILFDEFQSWEMAEESWRAATDATPCKIALGTPEGAAGKFAELQRGDEVKRKIRIWWYLHPNKIGFTPEHKKSVESGDVYDKVGKYRVEFKEESKEHKGCYLDQYGKIRSQWYDKQNADRSSDDIASNIDIDYLTTGRPIFDTRVCSARMAESVESPHYGELVWKIRPVFNDRGVVVNHDQLSVEFVPNSNGLYRIWEMPGKKEYEHGFCIGADTAEGLEQGDYDSAYVLRRFGTRPGVACSLHGHIRIHEYAEELAKVGVFYHGAIVNVERNNHGHGVILELVKLYKRLYHKDMFTRGYAEITDKIGWETTSMSKPSLIGQMGKWISENQFDCRDEKFWKETLTFVEDDGKMEAQGKSRGERCYDDRVMGLAITLWTHLNMPLPYKIVEVSDYQKRVNMSRKRKSVVGWTV